jgi:hypothetical protein
VQELLQMLEGEEPEQVAPVTDSESETEELQALLASSKGNRGKFDNDVKGKDTKV